MTKILYSKSNLRRKKKFKILTTIVKNDQDIKVYKESICSESNKHLLSILKNEKTWQNYIKDLGFVLPGKLINNNKIEYKYIDHSTLEYKIYENLANKNFTQATKYFKKGIDIINNFPFQKINKYPNKSQYKKIFGLEPEVNQNFILKGNIDVVAENIIIKNKKTFFIDCEWLFDFPIEVNFLKYRYTLNLLPKLKNLLNFIENDTFHSFGYQGLYIPSTWLKYAFPIQKDQEQIIKFAQKELYFQKYVFNTISQDQPIKSELSLLPPNTNAFTQIIKLTEENIQLNQKTLDNEQQKNIIENLNNSLNIIKSSKFYKLWQKYNQIKKYLKK